MHAGDAYARWVMGRLAQRCGLGGEATFLAALGTGSSAHDSEVARGAVAVTRDGDGPAALEHAVALTLLTCRVLQKTLSPGSRR
jgi:hypothetical protein